MDQLRSLLAADVTVYADGGGKTPAAGQPIAGLESVVQFHTSLAKLFASHPSRVVQWGWINGLPGFVTIEQETIVQTTALQIEDGKIAAVYVVRNPDKLRHVASELVQ
jgi:RNA polymerase sigma-70 factor (ECF subfamily)